MASDYKRDRAAVDRWRKENTSRFTINLKNEDRELWEQMAAENGMPLATFIRKLMNDYIENRK